MKLFKLPAKVAGIIFDMDNTLYTNEPYMVHTNAVLFGKFGEHLGQPTHEAEKIIRAYQADYALSHQGRLPSLGNSFAAYGVPITQSIAWRTDFLEPEQYLVPDQRLRQVIEALATSMVLSVVTNNPVAIAQRTLAAIGVDDLIPHIVGLDTFAVSKPAPQAFAEALRLMDVPPNQVVSVGDRLEIDIEPAMSLGTGGILIETVTEVYELATLLLKQ